MHNIPGMQLPTNSARTIVIISIPMVVSKTVECIPYVKVKPDLIDFTLTEGELFHYFSTLFSYIGGEGRRDFLYTAVQDYCTRKCVCTNNYQKHIQREWPAPVHDLVQNTYRHTYFIAQEI